MNNKKIENLLNIVDAEALYEMVCEVNNWNNSLEYLNYIYMEDFNDYMNNLEPIELAERIYFCNFNPNDDYFNFNGYGNLISYSQWEMEKELIENKEDIIKLFTELYIEGHIDIWNDEIKTILDNEEEE